MIHFSSKPSHIHCTKDKENSFLSGMQTERGLSMTSTPEEKKFPDLSKKPEIFETIFIYNRSK